MANNLSFEFDKRVNEVEYYFFCLQQMYLYGDQKQSDTLQRKLSDDNYSFKDFLIFLKANSFIVLYNLVEASIKNLILSIYDEISMQSLNYSEVCNDLKNIWINLNYKELGQTTTNYDQHKEKAKKIIDSIIEEKKIEFGDQVNIGGNADLKHIKTLFNSHGLTIPWISAESVGGGLLEIKNKRNNIAHGKISFIEAGRDSSSEDLCRYKDEVISFLKKLEKEVVKYIEDESYLSNI